MLEVPKLFANIPIDFSSIFGFNKAMMGLE